MDMYQQLVSANRKKSERYVWDILALFPLIQQLTYHRSLMCGICMIFTRGQAVQMLVKITSLLVSKRLIFVGHSVGIWTKNALFPFYSQVLYCSEEEEETVILSFSHLLSFPPSPPPYLLRRRRRTPLHPRWSRKRIEETVRRGHWCISL